MEVNLKLYTNEYKKELIADIIAFWKTHNCEPTEGDALEDLKHWTSVGHLLFLIYVDGLMCGFVHLGSRGSGIDWLEDIFVREEYRGQGIGSQAIEWIWEYIRKQGFETLYLEVVPANIEALRLYHKLGFTNLNTLTLNRSIKKKEVMGEETIQGFTFKTYLPNK